MPTTFLASPRFWREGADWLAALPDLVRTRCEQWQLVLDGEVMHGSNAIAVPVRRDGEPFVLRMTIPDDTVAPQARALAFWAGRGTVRLVQADPPAGAMLLERLDHTRSLARMSLADAVPLVARLMRRLGVTGPPADAPSTTAIARARADDFEETWRRHGEPFGRNVLDLARACAKELSTSTSDLAVDGDLHYEQVLGGSREPWLAVDPVLLRGDIEYDLARLLWSRLDEMRDAAELRGHVATIVAEADLDAERARTWIVFRSVDYWLWGLDHGLTEDPERCRRLVSVFGS